MPDPIRLLVVEDSADDARLILDDLVRYGFDPTAIRVDTEADYLTALETAPDIILSDYRLPRFSGLRALELLKQTRLDIPFIVVSGALDDEMAAALIKQGANDFLLKDRLARLGSAVEQALQARRAREQQQKLAKTLEQSEARFRTLVECSPDAIFVRRKGEIVFVNEAGMRLLGAADPSQVIGKSMLSLLHPDYHELVRQRIHRIDEDRVATGPVEQIFIRFDGSTIATEVSAVPVVFEGEPAAQIIARDITDRKRMEQALRAREMEVRLVTDNVPAIISYLDQDLKYRFVNKRYTEVFGLSMADVVGKQLSEIVGDTVYQLIKGHYVTVLKGQRVTYQRPQQLPNGETRIMEIKLVPHVGEQGTIVGCYALTIDITEHKKAEEHIQRLAHYDNLTNLPNRMLFYDRLGQAISVARRDRHQLALLYLDLDKFKAVNDTLGHHAGDELLKNVAERIRHQLRQSDTVARIGGDEFTVILPRIADRHDLAKVAEKIINALSTKFYLSGAQQEVSIGTSIGIAIFPVDAEDMDTLVKAADTAMYNAKRIGNCVRFCGA